MIGAAGWPVLNWTDFRACVQWRGGRGTLEWGRWQMRPQGGRTGAETTDEECGGPGVEETGRGTGPALAGSEGRGISGYI